jgi:hypothetical protein
MVYKCLYRNQQQINLMNEREQLIQAIAQIEAQREVLGDAATEAAQAVD